MLLVGNYLADRQQSMQRFAALMERGLREAGHDPHIIRPPAVFGRIRPSANGLGKWLGYVDKFWLFPPLLRKAARSVDVVHICDHSNAIYTRHLRHTPHVVTCHDLLAVRSARGEISENPTAWTGRQLQRMIAKGLNAAHHVACVSEFTREDVARITTCSNERMSVVRNGLNYPYSPMPGVRAIPRLRALRLETATPFVLHVGNNSWYKNRMGVLHIYSALLRHEATKSLSLVLAGSPWTKEMQEFVSQQQVQHKVYQLIRPDNEDLCALYSMATALLFPSLQEGFGWPLIEAQACGCPVITSHRPPMTEVAGDAALYINPEDPESAARLIAARHSELPALRAAGFANVQRFTVGAMIDAYVRIYNSVQVLRT